MFPLSHVVEFPKLGLSFTVHETAFSIGGFDVRWYGIIIACGFLLALVYASRSAQKMNIDMDRLFDAVIVGLIGSVICARLYYVIFYPGDKYWKNPIEILKIHEGGLAIYGAIIGALVCGGIMAKIRKLKVPAVLDLASLGFLIGQCVGRWGNFVNQEAFGTVTDLPWAMYSDNTEAVAGGAVHPCFLYESLLCLLGFFLLHVFTRKFRRYDGQTFLLYIVWYGISRFFIEGIRTDSLMIPFLGLRVSQVLAALCVIVGVVLLIVFRHKTSLTGCGNAFIMESIALSKPSEQDLPANRQSVFTAPAGEETSADTEPERSKEEKEETSGEKEENASGKENTESENTEDTPET